MSFEQDIELIDSYNDWVLERKRMATDLTPEAFLEDKMKQDAASRVIRAVEYIDGSKSNDPDLANVEAILRGDL